MSVCVKVRIDPGGYVQTGQSVIIYDLSHFVAAAYRQAIAPTTSYPSSVKGRKTLARSSPLLLCLPAHLHCTQVFILSLAHAVASQ